MNNTGRNAPDIKFAKDLPLKRHRMEELSAMLESLQHSKESVAQSSYENLQRSYTQELNTLQEETEALQKRLEASIGSINELSATLQDESKLFRKDLEEHAFLMNQNAISKEHYSKKKRDLDKKIRANEQGLRSNASLLEEASFYQSYVGQKTYLQHRAERLKEKGQDSLDSLSQGAGRIALTLRTLLSGLNYKRIALYAAILILMILTLTNLGRIRDEVAWRGARVKHTCDAYDAYMSRYDTYRTEAERGKEDCLWESVQGVTAPYKVDAYLSLYEHGEYKFKALSLKDSLTWDSVKTVNTYESFYFYRDNFTSGKYIGEAKDSIRSKGTGSFVDPRDDQEYKWVRIGEQIWMAENLAYRPSIGSYWAYDNDEGNLAKYGYLYDWETACNVCPIGWRLPSEPDLNKLLNYYKIKNINIYQGLMDSNGFSAILGGMRTSNGVLLDFKTDGFLWTSEDIGALHAVYAHIKSSSKNAYLGYHELFKILGFNVRCLKED